MMMIVIIIMGNECIWRTLLGGSTGGRRGKERMLRDEEDENKLNTYYKVSRMRRTKHCLKHWERRGMGIYWRD
jgi:hypothetical protein